MKPEKAAKIVSQLPGSTPMNQPQSQIFPSKEDLKQQV